MVIYNELQVDSLKSNIKDGNKAKQKTGCFYHIQISSMQCGDIACFLNCSQAFSVNVFYMTYKEINKVSISQNPNWTMTCTVIFFTQHLNNI